MLFSLHILTTFCGGKEVGKPNLDNIGFIKNPPKELREKFPMCDAVLHVDWIDKDEEDLVQPV